MSIAFIDEQMIQRPGAPRLRVAHAPRRTGSTRVAGRRTASSEVVVVRPIQLQAERVALVEPQPRSAAPRPTRLRLTPRGRLVLGALLVLVALLVFSLGRFSAGAVASGPVQHVTVQSGDTLWSIASHAAPAADPRVEVQRIIAANHLAGGASLTPGDTLLVP